MDELAWKWLSSLWSQARNWRTSMLSCRTEGGPWFYSSLFYYSIVAAHRTRNNTASCKWLRALEHREPLNVPQKLERQPMLTKGERGGGKQQQTVFTERWRRGFKSMIITPPLSLSFWHALPRRYMDDINKKNGYKGRRTSARYCIDRRSPYFIFIQKDQG